MSAAIVMEAMRAVEDTRREITQLARGQSDGWTAAYGRLRPVLDDRIAALSRTGDAWLRANGTPEQCESFRDLIAKARRATMQHQAKWPVLVIKSGNDDYHASVKTIDEAFAALVAFVGRLPR
jgi:hypothetical protein